MSIIYNDNNKTFTLHTANTTYQIGIGKYGFLLHYYYGDKIPDQDLSYLLYYYDRGFSGNPYDTGEDRTFSLDTLPLEISTFGLGDYRESCIDLENADGSIALDLRYQSSSIFKGKYKIDRLPQTYGNCDEVESLEISLLDDVSKIEVVLQYAVFDAEDIITRSVQIINHSTDKVYLKKALSCCLDFNYPGKQDWITFHGRYSYERIMERTSLSHGKIRVDSMRGASSHHQNPFVILCNEESNENSGNCYALMFVYSGNFIAQAEKDQISQTRVVIGMQPKNFSWELGNSEIFQCPEVIMSYSCAGFNQLSYNLHRILREHVCRGKYVNARRPVLINNWEATYFDFDDEKLLNIAKSAAVLGIELFVMDDGWFGERNDDTLSLGDWYVNINKIKCGLKKLADQINGLGMQFGIWMEPEMVSEKSQLYKQHPEWCLNIPGRRGVRSRYQYVLDMSNKEVIEYLYQQISAILDSANIAYLKWDMNRHLSNVWSSHLPKERQEEVWHRYMLGLYDLLERIIQKYPDILLETCSGGGGRFDAGMLYYSPQIWCSDNTDAIDRIDIQYGTSFGYPVSTIGSHVSACPNQRTGRNIDLRTRGIVAMSGTFGYELDISKMTEAEKEVIKKQVTYFRENWEIISRGRYYRLSNPLENHDYAAWMSVSSDKQEAIFSFIQIRADSNPEVVRIFIPGLDESKRYTINEYTISGIALKTAGINMPMNLKDGEAYSVRLKAM